jgi:hypothetical protein
MSNKRKYSSQVVDGYERAARSEKAQNQGISTQLLDKIMQKALADNVSKVFALSRHNSQWFLKQDFVKMDISELPKKRQALFDHQRNSSEIINIVIDLSVCSWQNFVLLNERCNQFQDFLRCIQLCI